jgi:hypothetical protein
VSISNKGGNLWTCTFQFFSAKAFFVADVYQVYMNRVGGSRFEAAAKWPEF